MFETVNDMIVEDDEVMSFEATTRNELDVFVNGTGFSLTVYDDDGKLDSTHGRNRNQMEGFMNG